MTARTWVSRSGKVLGINAELLDARNQCSPIDCHTRRSAVCASNTTSCLAQNAHDLQPLPRVMLFGCVSCALLADFADRFFYNSGNLVLRIVVVRDGEVD